MTEALYMEPENGENPTNPDEQRPTGEDAVDEGEERRRPLTGGRRSFGPRGGAPGRMRPPNNPAGDESSDVPVRDERETSLEELIAEVLRLGAAGRHEEAHNLLKEVLAVEGGSVDEAGPEILDEKGNVRDDVISAAEKVINTEELTEEELAPEEQEKMLADYNKIMAELKQEKADVDELKDKEHDQLTEEDRERLKVGMSRMMKIKQESKLFSVEHPKLKKTIKIAMYTIIIGTLLSYYAVIFGLSATAGGTAPRGKGN